MTNTTWSTRKRPNKKGKKKQEKHIILSSSLYCRCLARFFSETVACLLLDFLSLFLLSRTRGIGVHRPGKEENGHCQLRANGNKALFLGITQITEISTRRDSVFSLSFFAWLSCVLRYAFLLVISYTATHEIGKGGKERLLLCGRLHLDEIRDSLQDREERDRKDGCGAWVFLSFFLLFGNVLDRTWRILSFAFGNTIFLPCLLFGDVVTLVPLVARGSWKGIFRQGFANNELRWRFVLADTGIGDDLMLFILV